MKACLPFAATLVAALAPTLVAQGFSCPTSGIGARRTTVDLDTATGQTLHNGLAVLNGEIFVATDPTTGPKPVFVFDFQGNLVRQFDAPPTASATANGYLDGASDGVATLIWCHDDGVEFTDVNGNPVTTVVAANGTQTVGANPLTGIWEPGLGIIRGIAYDPAGNGGNGSILIGDLTDSIVEIDLDGNILRIYGNLLFWDVNGLALTSSGDILVNNDNNDGPILTIDRQTGLPTGFSVDLDRGNLEGAGCELVQDPSGVGSLFVTVNENTGDELVLYQFERFAGIDESGIMLEQRVDQEPFTRGTVRVLPSTTDISFQMSSPTPGPGLMYINFGPDVNVCADNTLFGAPFAALSDLFVVTPFSQPFGIPFEVRLPPNQPVTFPAAPLLQIVARNEFRAQALIALPGIPAPFLPVVPTNEIRFEVLPNILGITVSADGANNFNSDTTSGFWTVTNGSNDPNKAITSVVFDWVNAVNNPFQASHEFDTDQTGMADNFENGNSMVAACAGTYRNSSDVMTGLIYDTMNTPTSGTCDPSANTGWIGTNPTTVVDDYRTLEWRFSPGSFFSGASFEVDVDTDGTGTAGDDMVGMIVILTLADGTILTDELLVTGTNRSEVLF